MEALDAPDTVGPDAGDRGRWRTAEWAVLAVAAVVYVAFVHRSSVTIDGIRTSTLFDDAMISMRYGRNLADGNGLVFNRGEAVEGYTNLLWTLVMAGVHKVVSDVRRTSLVVSAIGVVVLLTQLLIVRLAAIRSTDRPWAPTVAMAGVAAGFALVFWTLRGMEVGLVGLLVTTALLLVHVRVGWSVRARVLGATTLLTLAVFTRDDALVLAAAVAAGALPLVPAGRRVRAAVALAGGFVAVAALRVGLRLAMYGDWVPNTYRLKVAGVPRALLVERGALSTGYTMVFGLGVLVAVACLGWRSGHLARAVLLLVAAQAGYALLVGGDAWEDRGFASRFLATVTAPLVLGAVLGVMRVARGEPGRWPVVGASVVLAGTAVFALAAPGSTSYFQLGQGGPAALALRLGTVAATGGAVLCTRWPRTRGVGVAALAVLVVTAPNALPWASWARHGQPFEDTERRWAQYGLALRDATQPDATIAAASIGNIGYFSERDVVDLLGKIDPVVAGTPPHTDYWALPGHLRWDYRHSIVTLRPDVVAQLFATTPSDVPMIVASGYRQLGPMVFVRDDARITSPAAVQRAASLAR